MSCSWVVDAYRERRWQHRSLRYYTSNREPLGCLYTINAKLTPILKSLMIMIKSAGSNTDLCGTPLVTGRHSKTCAMNRTLIPTLTLLMVMIKSAGSSTEPCGTPLVTGRRSETLVYDGPKASLPPCVPTFYPAVTLPPASADCTY